MLKFRALACHQSELSSLLALLLDAIDTLTIKIDHGLSGSIENNSLSIRLFREGRGGGQGKGRESRKLSTPPLSPYEGLTLRLL